MANEIKKEIADKLLEIYPEVTIYYEYLPQNFSVPCFLISLHKQSYNKRLGSIYHSVLSFDITYYSEKEQSKMREDCNDIQFILFREFDLLENYRAVNKKAEIVEDILHFTFDIMFSEIWKEEREKMGQVNTNITERMDY